MPRSASKSIFKSKTAPVNTSNPAPTSSVVVHKTETPGFFSNVMQGFGLGAGQSLAMNLFRSPTEVRVSNPNGLDTPTHPNSRLQSTKIGDDYSEVKHTYQVSPDSLSKEYVQCMKESQNNKEACKQYLE